MLPEQGPEIPICDAHKWDSRWYGVHGWRHFRRVMLMAFSKSRRSARRDPTPEARFTQLLLEVTQGREGKWSDHPVVLERLEARLAATDDLAVRKVFTTYLSEP